MTEIAKRVDRYPGPTHRQLSSLVRSGVLVADREEGRREVYYTLARGKTITAHYPFGRATFELN